MAARRDLASTSQQTIAQDIPDQPTAAFASGLVADPRRAAIMLATYDKLASE